jgi:hypothetical protein
MTPACLSTSSRFSVSGLPLAVSFLPKDENMQGTEYDVDVPQE